MWELRRVQGSGIMVWGSGSMNQLGLRVWGRGYGVDLEGDGVDDALALEALKAGDGDMELG